MDYTEEMKQVIREWKKSVLYDPQAYYMFVLSGSVDATEVGYMPLGRRFGFLFRNNRSEEELLHTLAHELGHGLFTLRHTFSPSNRYYQSQTSTDNLMSYGPPTATRLYKYQWDQIQSPALALFSWMEREEEGELSLPCKGWLDNCDNVIGILDTIRSARIQGKKVRVRGKINEEPSILTAKYVKIGGTDYKQIRLISNKKKSEYIYNPLDYEAYSQQFFNTDGTIDMQNGFVYREDGQEVFKIIIDDESSKIEKLKEYLFGLDKEKSEKNENHVPIEVFLKAAQMATQIASKYTSSTACNICVRSALYLMKNDSALFPTNGSGFNDPENNFKLREVKGFITPQGKAINIKNDFDNLISKIELYERFVEIPKKDDEGLEDYFQRLQNEADQGAIIIGVMLNASCTIGHVMMITPGGLVTVDENELDWGYTFTSRGIKKLPKVLECGDKDREYKAPLCRNVDRKGAQERLKWFMYKK